MKKIEKLRAICEFIDNTTNSDVISDPEWGEGIAAAEMLALNYETPLDEQFYLDYIYESTVGRKLHEENIQICKEKGHLWEHEAHIGPDSGTEWVECTRCHESHKVVFY